MTNLYSFAGIYERCWIRQTPSAFCKACKTNSLYGNPNPKNTLTASGERGNTANRYSTPKFSKPFLSPVRISLTRVVSIPGPCSSAMVWSSTNDVCTLHFIAIYMAKAAAERLFMTRRILKCGLKCWTKIKSNNIGIDTHASLHEQIFFVRLIFAD